MNQKSIKDKMIKRIMQLEKELWIPAHIPAGTEEDPKPSDMREFTEDEIENCGCSNCKYPYEYWEAKTDVELQKDLSSLEYTKVNPV